RRAVEERRLHRRAREGWRGGVEGRGLVPGRRGAPGSAHAGAKWFRRGAGVPAPAWRPVPGAHRDHGAWRRTDPRPGGNHWIPPFRPQALRPAGVAAADRIARCGRVTDAVALTLPEEQDLETARELAHWLEESGRRKRSAAWLASLHT